MAIDNFRKVNITLNKANQHVLETQIAKVGDANGRELVVQITNNGVIENQFGTTLKLNWQHENGKQGSTDFKVVDIKTGKFSVYYPKEMLYKGKVNANIEITSNGQITNSMNFKIIVQADVFDGEAGNVDGVFISLADVNKKLEEREEEYTELKDRQLTVENQFNSLQQEMTDKDVVSAPEIIAARTNSQGVTEDTLKGRIDNQEYYINLTSFGAVPNDPTFDSTEYIQNAVDSASVGQKILITGKFYISKPIRLPKHTISFEGLNYRETGLIKMNNFEGEAAIILAGENSSDVNRIKYSQFRNFFIEGNNRMGDGIIMKHMNFPIIENVMVIRNNGTGVYFEDVQDLQSVNLISIYNKVNSTIFGRCTGFDFYKSLLKYGGERNLLITTDGQLDGDDYAYTNRADRITFWGGLIEGDSFTQAPETEQSLVALLGCTKITFNDVGFSKGKFSDITGIKIDRVVNGGITYTPGSIFFNNNIMHASTPQETGVGINVVQANNVVISKFKAPGVATPIKVGSQAFETVITRDCEIDFAKIINESSTTFENSRASTGLWSSFNKMILKERSLRFESSDTTNTREFFVDGLTRQTILRRTTGVEGEALDYFKIYGSGIFEPHIFRINPTNPTTTLSGVLRINNGNFEIRNATNNGWDVYQRVLTGTTTNRPSTNRFDGQQYLDTTIGKPIWWLNGKGWIDATGAVV